MAEQPPRICQHCNNLYHGLDHWRTCPQSERNRLLQIEAAHRDARSDLDKEIRGLTNTNVSIDTIIDVLRIVVANHQEPRLAVAIEHPMKHGSYETNRRIYAAIWRTLQRNGDNVGSLVAVQDCYLSLIEQRDTTRSTQSGAPAPINSPQHERTNFPSSNDGSDQPTGGVGEQVRQALQSDSSSGPAPERPARSAGTAHPMWTAAEDDILSRVVAELPDASWEQRRIEYNTRARAQDFPERPAKGMSARFRKT